MVASRHARCDKADRISAVVANSGTAHPGVVGAGTTDNCGAIATTLTPASGDGAFGGLPLGGMRLKEPQAAAGLPGPVTLDRRQYEQQLEQAVARVGGLPYDEAEARTTRLPVAVAVVLAPTSGQLNSDHERAANNN